MKRLKQSRQRVKARSKAATWSANWLCIQENNKNTAPIATKCDHNHQLKYQNRGYLYR